MAEDGTNVPGESKGSSMSPVEERARSKGWRPLEEYKGDPGDWVDAKEFVGREKLFDKIHDLRNQVSRQAQKFEQDMSRISTHFAKVQETEYKRAKSDLERQLQAAKQAEDVEAVAEVAGQLKEVEAEAKQAANEAKQAQQAVRQGGPTPEFVDWQKDNKWFGPEGDAEMTADAIAIGTGWSAANPNKSQKDVLEYVTKKIKKMYGDGESTTQEKKQVDNRVEGGGVRRSENKKKGQITVSDLDDTQRAVMNTLIKRGALKDIAKKNNRTQQEEYLAQLAERM